MSARKLPPYGRELAQHLRGDLTRWPGTSPDGTHATIWIGCGPEGWRWVRERRDLLLVLATPNDPAACDWRLVQGHDPILIVGNALPDEVHALAAALLRDGTLHALDVATGALHRRAA